MLLYTSMAPDCVYASMAQKMGEVNSFEKIFKF